MFAGHEDYALGHGGWFARGIYFLQDFLQGLRLFIIGDHNNLLENGFVGVQVIRITEFDFNWTSKKLSCESLHFLRPCGGEEHRLSLQRNLSYDSSNLRFESHVQPNRNIFSEKEKKNEMK